MEILWRMPVPVQALMALSNTLSTKMANYPNKNDPLL